MATIAEQQIRDALTNKGYDVSEMGPEQLLEFADRLPPDDNKPPPPDKRKIEHSVEGWDADDKAFRLPNSETDERGSGYNFTLAHLDPGLYESPTPELLIKAPARIASDITGVAEENVRALQQMHNQVWLAALLLGTKGENQHVSTPTICRELKMFSLYRAMFRGEAASSGALSAARKAMDTAESGAGADWIPTGFSADLWRRVELELRVATIFDEFPMPTSPFKLPVQGDKVTAYKASESTGDTGTAIRTGDAATSSVQFDAVKIAVRCLFSDELSEDSIIPILPHVESELVFALADGIESCTVNGDTQTTHFDVGYTVQSYDVRRCWEGIRRLQNKQSSSVASVSLSSFTAANLLLLKAKMGKWGTNPREGAWLTSMQGYAKMLGLTECLTREKYGSAAVIHKGELAQLFGSPVFVSEHVASDLNASGIYDGSSTDKTIVLYVNRRACKFGRRSSNVESDRIIEYGQRQVVASVRLDLEEMADPASEPFIGLGYAVATV